MAMIAWLLAACAPSSTYQVGTLVAEPVGRDAHSQAFVFHGVARAPVLVCRSLELDDEVHRLALAGSPPAAVLHGLLAQHPYRCVVDGVRGTSPETRFVTPPLHPTTPLWMLEEGSLDEPPSYTAFSAWRDRRFASPAHALYIVDERGRPRARLALSQASVDASLVPLARDRLLVNPGALAAVQVADPSGEVLEAFASPEFGDRTHHELDVADGEVVTLTNPWVTRGELGWRGFAVELLDLDSGEHVWSWHAQDGVDVGALPVPEGAVARPDVWHANAADLVDDALGESVYVSLARASLLVRIDRASGAITHTLGEGSAFALTGAEGVDARWFHGQHDPSFDGDRVLMVDNGTEDVGSRVVEMELDLDRHTAHIAWTWTEPGWFEPYYGSVQRLDDGRVVLGRGHCDKCTDHNEEDSQIVVFDPDSGEVSWRLRLVDAGLYRARRFDGCHLFARQGACPDGSVHTPEDDSVDEGGLAVGAQP